MRAIRYAKTNETPRYDNGGATGAAASGAEDGTRTRDLLLGKEMLYQLSHFRINRRRISILSPNCQPNLAPIRARNARISRGHGPASKVLQRIAGEARSIQR